MFSESHDHRDPLAAAVAEGTSTINNAYVIDRGYEKIEQRLAALGLNIRREPV